MARKKYHEIELPLIDEKVELLAEKKEHLAGKSVKTDLTRKIRSKNFEMTFKINDQLEAEPYRLYVYKYFLRRMMRKSVDYVEDSFTVSCKDGKLRVKPFLIARKKVSRKVRKALRDKAKEETKKYMEKLTFREILESLLNNEFQKELSLVLKKIYPLSLCEIKEIYIESKAGEGESDKVKKAKKKAKAAAQE